MLKFKEIKKPAIAGFFIFQNLIIVGECLGTKIALTEIIFCKELRACPHLKNWF